MVRERAYERGDDGNRRVRTSTGSIYRVSGWAFPALLLALLLPALPALAGDAKKPLTDPTAKATKLEKEAKVYFRKAGNTDLSPGERKKARKAAYQRLLKARNLLDAWLKVHPEDEKRLDSLYVDISSMMYWIAKESGIGDLGSAGSSEPTEPSKPRKKGPHPKAPAKPKGPSAAQVLAKIEKYQKKYPGDVPGLYHRYEDFLTRFPNRAAPEYAKAVAELKKLGKKLKDVYRLVRNQDPDSLAHVDSKETLKLVAELSDDLKHGSVPVQVRAARYLAGLGSGSAAPPLIEALFHERKGPVFDAAADALAKIGGRRVDRRLVRIRMRSFGPAVVRILTESVKLGGLNARIAAAALGKYVRKQPRKVQIEATKTLFDAGRDGAVGLAIAIDLAPVEKKVAYIQHLGKLGVPECAGHLTQFLTLSPIGAGIDEGRAARKAILAIGMPGVPYLIPCLDDSKVEVWTAEMLHRITGAHPRNDERRTWERWYRHYKEKLEERR